LCAIVRNESARVERMLDSVKDVISAFVILDTGSSDDTVEKIKLWGSMHHIPGVVAQGAFVNFSQARNQALDAARSWRNHPGTPPFDYFLLCDADMELRVEAPSVFNDLTGEAYELTQRAGSYSYNNLRLLAAWSIAKYVGVTHEYLNTRSSGVLVGTYFIDHADGANRGEKTERDIRLFEEDLKVDPNNGRTWFYLGNTYRDAGRFVDAERCYRRKLELPTWDEEDWLAQVNLANCLERQGRDAEYLSATLDAYQKRPTRAEPLHALAKYHRLKGHYGTATMFAEKGLSIPRPNDRLFIEDWVYDWGLREEYSIAGYYDPATRDRAFKINDGLATDPNVPEYLRQNARSNAVFYLRPLKEFCPSYSDAEVAFTPSPGFTAMNPCIVNRTNGGLELLLRTVNYRIDEHGCYMIGPKACGDAPIETENWLLQLRNNLTVRNYTKVEWERPPAAYNMVIGLEDMRVFWNQGERQFIACVRETSLDGVPQQVHGFLQRNAVDNTAKVASWATISDSGQCEKNWAPVLGHSTKGVPYMYRLDKIQRGALQQKIPCKFAVDNISGGSPFIPFEDGYLAVVHEAIAHPSHGRRIYQHRFAWLDQDLLNHRLSLPFVFHDVQIEFAAGLARGTYGELVISFGERDAKAWLAKVNQYEVAAMLGFGR
jgi:tetratricopeptide (TPR) repeat protein